MCEVAFRLGIFLIIFLRTANCVQFEKSPNLIANQNDKAEINCKHDDNNLVVMLWYRQQRTGMPLDLIGYGYTGSPPNPEPGFTERFTQTRQNTMTGSLTISDLTLSDSALYFCAARQGANTQAYFGSGTKLTVLDPKIKVSEEQDLNVTIIKPSEKESCKKTVTLVCVAKDFYPDHVSITWMVGGKPRTEGVATDPNAFREQETEHFTISSRLKVPRKEWNNEKTEFKCTLKFYDGKDYLYKENKVNGIAGSGYTREDYVKSSQMIKLSYGVFIAKSALYGLVIFVYVWRKGSGK